MFDKNTMILQTKQVIKDKLSATDDELVEMFNTNVGIRDKKLYKRYHTLQIEQGCTHKKAVVCTDNFFKGCHKLSLLK